jgi:hypothetical protein
MRREIEAALDSQRNIVPLMLEGFSFGAPTSGRYLTGRLAALTRYNGLAVPPTFFAEAMERLRNRFLNVPVDAVLHSPSVSAQRVATEQKDKAASAAEAEERRRDDDERRRQEAEAKRRLDEAEAGKLRQDKERRKLEKEAAWHRWRRAPAAAGAVVLALLVMIGGIWLYRTTIPAGVTSTTIPAGATSPVAQSDEQNAENAKAQAKEETTKPAGVMPAVVQSDQQNPEMAETLAKQQAAFKELQEFVDKQSEITKLTNKGLRVERITPLDIGLANMTDDLRRILKINDTVKGVVVIEHMTYDVIPGDVITAILPNPVASTDDVRAEIGRLKKQGRESALLQVISIAGNGQVSVVAVHIK